MDERICFEGPALEALRGMVSQWIYEGFTTPPYSSAQYDVFEALGLDKQRSYSYDTRRPR